jgi:hypothetical protein
MADARESDRTNAIWDDGEWIIWDEMSQLQYRREVTERSPMVQEIVELETLVDATRAYRHQLAAICLFSENSASSKRK